MICHKEKHYSKQVFKKQKLYEHVIVGESHISTLDNKDQPESSIMRSSKRHYKALYKFDVKAKSFILQRNSWYKEWRELSTHLGRHETLSVQESSSFDQNAWVSCFYGVWDGVANW